MPRGIRFAIVVALVAVALAPGSVARAAAPPGATARCDDGTYSFSQTHSGTCSHHGGVATWIGATATTSPFAFGSTVLLLTRTRTAGCTPGALPDRHCSPGAYYSGLSRASICSAGFRTADIRNVPEAQKHQVEVEYGLVPRGYGSTLEIDHIVSLELGGSNDIANLFPERAPGFRSKDKLENRLHDLVCGGKMTLRSAQEQIAADWKSLYGRVFGG